MNQEKEWKYLFKSLAVTTSLQLSFEMLENEDYSSQIFEKTSSSLSLAISSHN